jgi:hypothetical protein
MRSERLIGFTKTALQVTGRYPPFRAALVLLLLSAAAAAGLSAQRGDSLRYELAIGIEVRPRFEFRAHHRLRPDDTAAPNVYATQRNQLQLDYQRKTWLFHTSWQEIHLWGERGQPSSIGSIHAYELYVEPRLLNNLSVRIGRQALSLDNGRLFSAAPWAQQCRAHEGLRFFYGRDKLNMDLTLASTRPYSDLFRAEYSPVASHRYKLLLVHHLVCRISERFRMTAINSLDVSDRPDASTSNPWRVTSGGRVEFVKGDMALTANAYYQYGQDASQRSIRAYYLQPEAKVAMGKMTLRLGAEILSGQPESRQAARSRSFLLPYGVAWKFMGNMNFFARFPGDVQGSGLLNPYLFTSYQARKQLMLRADINGFFSQHPLLDNGSEAARYLGFESDWSLHYKPRQDIEINFGFSVLIPHESIKLLGKVEDTGRLPVWSYLMVSYRPEVFRRGKVS